MNNIKLTPQSQKDLKFRSLKDLKIYPLSLTTAKLTEFEAWRNQSLFSLTAQMKEMIIVQNK